LAAGTIGSDTGGSIRVPASMCGCVGVKPSFGRVSAAGVMPLARTFDHVGPLARTVEDAAILLGAIAGYDPADALTVAVRSPTTAPHCECHRRARRGSRSTLRALLDDEVRTAAEAAPPPPGWRDAVDELPTPPKRSTVRSPGPVVGCGRGVAPLQPAVVGAADRLRRGSRTLYSLPPWAR
jgi:Asp-tRNA(Asn)/Glu-tRNA(Gln) amidotransferase A subunit family amidase